MTDSGVTAMSDEYVDPETVIGYARLLEPGDKVYIGLSDREMKNPLQVRDVEVTDWDSFETARIDLDGGVVNLHAGEHTIVACSGKKVRWEQSGQERLLRKFDPVDYDVEDLAVRDFGDRIEEAMWDDGAPVEPAAVAPEPETSGQSEPSLGARVPCNGCGGSVTKAYAKVFSPDDEPTSVEACPGCETMTRGRDGRPRVKRQHQSGDD